MKKSKVIFDMVLNIIATAIPTIALQLLILPYIANYMSGDEYGLVVTILSVLNVIPATIGNMLNNVRLLHQKNYSDEKPGDYQLIFCIFESVNILIMAVISIYYLGFSDIIGNILVVIIGVLWLGREYHIVTFRLKLNYIAIMLNNIFLVLGYFVGYLFFRMTGYWQFIYLCGFICSYLYIGFNSKIIFEPFIYTKNFSKITIDTLYLIIASVLARAMSYADKILLYPLLGGTMVSIYYAATLFGKVVGLAITPINSVALSYLSRVNKNPRSLFKWTLVVGSILCLAGYFAVLVISRPILTLLYPKFVDGAMEYIYFTTAAMVISVLTTLVNPFVLRFFDIKWQIAINAITTVGYILISLLLLKLFGMTGFCIGVLIANIIKLLVTVLIYYKASDDDNY